MLGKTCKKVVLVVLTISLIFGISFAIYAATTERVDIVCNDINLYNALKNELPNSLLITTNNSTKTISIPEDMLNDITTLSLKNAGIYDLTGLENFTNLTELNLSKNEI